MSSAKIDELLRLGGAEYEAGNLTKAASYFENVLAMDPDHAEANNALGSIVGQCGLPDLSLELLSKAIRANPNVGHYHGNLGNIQKQLGRLDDALASFDRAIALDPNGAEAWSNKGVALLAMGRRVDALACCRQAVAVGPVIAAMHFSLGIALKENGLREEAVSNYRRAIALKPDFVDAHMNLGALLYDLWRLDEAIASYRAAVAVRPDNADAHNNLALALLAAGHVKEGLDEYEWRWGTPAGREGARNAVFVQPQWDGIADLGGKTVLVWGEQGLGDQILWAAFMPEMVARAGTCIVECVPKIVPLLTRSFPKAEVRPINRDRDAMRTDFDYHVPMGSLFRLLGATVPRSATFLVPDPDRVAFWRTRLATLGAGPFIGAAWTSSVKTGERALAYAEVDDWGPVFAACPGVYVSLQHGDCDKDLKDATDKYGVVMHKFADLDLFDNLDDVAALTAALDFVISVATAVIAIAAGVGTPAWRLTWRQDVCNNVVYGLAGPSVAYFHRSSDEPWGAAFAEVGRRLRKFAARRGEMAEVGDLLLRAQTEYNAGRLAPAASLYEKVLGLHPGHPEASNSLGVITGRLGMFDVAAELLAGAIQAEPDNASYHNNLGNVSREQGRPEDALASFDRAVALKPDYAEAHGNRGIALAALGRVDDAVACYRIAIGHRPDFAEVHNNLGAALTSLGRVEEAVAAYGTAIAIRPDYTEAHNDLGSALTQAGRPGEAIASYDRAIAIRPDYAEAHYNRGLVLQNQGRLAEAAESCRRAIAIRPDYTEAHNNLGVILFDMWRLDAANASYRQAIVHFEKAIAIKPDYALAYNNLGNVYNDLERYEDAVALYEKAIAFSSGLASAHTNMGNALRDLGRLEEALVMCRKAVALDPNQPEAHGNLGILLQELGQEDEAVVLCEKAIALDPGAAKGHLNLGTVLLYMGRREEAVASYRRAIAIAPALAEAHANLGLALLAMGQSREGYAELEWRWRKPASIDRARLYRFPRPMWDGKADLSGKSILIWGEQGVGDEVLWASCIPDVIARAGRCLVECTPKLVPLFTRSFPRAEVRPADPAADPARTDFDCHLPMGSLYRHFLPEDAPAPRATAFLVPDPDREAFWKARLDALGSGIKVGVAWTGSLVNATRSRGYTRLEDWAPVLAAPRSVFINLQHGDRRSEVMAAKDLLGVVVHDFADLDLFDDLADVAALARALDVAICVDTAVAAVVAGVGTPTWRLSWRRSPYNSVLFDLPGPSVAYFYRDADEPWDEAFAAVRRRLDEGGLTGA